MGRHRCLEGLHERMARLTLEGARDSDTVVVDQPYKMVDVTAKDVTVFDSLDEAFGIENTNRGDLTYEEMVQKIQVVNVKRDEAMLENMHLMAIEDSETSEAVKEMAIKEPQKLAARRSILLEADKLIRSAAYHQRRRRMPHQSVVVALVSLRLESLRKVSLCL